MNYPDIDTRTKDDIIDKMKELAVSYTPEWRFDEQNPDLGTALAYIYADMFEHTIHRFNRVTFKQEIEFFTQIGTKLLPSVPASGYVTFSLVNQEVSGTLVKKGTKVLSEVDTDTGKPVVFETENHVFVTPAQIDDIIMVNGKQDYICPVYSREMDSTIHSFTLFKADSKNAQEHILYFSQDTVLNINGIATIALEFENIDGRYESKWMEKMIKSGSVMIEYSTEYGYLPFREIKVHDHQIILQHTRDMAPFRKIVEQEEENYWIRMTIQEIDGFELWNLARIKFSSKAEKIRPDMISSNEVEQTVGNFLPFGEYYSVYDELYIACEEALSKKGATVTMKFTLGFKELPPENPVDLPTVQWKPIMKKVEFVQPPKYEITISKVIWEYFNGHGWCRLFEDTSYEDIFLPKEHLEETRQEVVFSCPSDIEPILVNSRFSYYIRARVLKVNNAYKVNADCITPVMDSVYFDYQYGNRQLPADLYIARNNLDTVKISNSVLSEKKGFYPFKRWNVSEYAMYFGFEIPPQEALVRILFEMGETIQDRMPRIQVTYSSKEDWKPLNVIDQTENFRRTGLLTIIGSNDFEKKRLFGKERYWIRFQDVTNQYSKNLEIKKYPQIIKVVPNTTEVLAIEKMLPEYFFIEPNQENYTCRLLEGKIYHINVWIDEKNSLSRKEMDEVSHERKTDFKYTESGELKEAWVLWERVESFSMSKPRDRHYMVDEIEGIVYFSDGICGAIPSAGDTETIRIEYSCGGGESGNLREGAIHELYSSQGFINQVYNPLMTTGGCNQETVLQAISRSARAIKHGNRAVMPKDYEALAMEASRSIIKAKCFASMNSEGKTEYGSVTLVLLHKNYEQVSKFFEGIREKVMDYMRYCLPGNLKEMQHFHIIEPRLLKFNVVVSLSVMDYNQIFDVKENVIAKLYEFIHPITGNFNHKGFDIGVLPNTTQIMNAIKMIPGIAFIHNVRITAYMRGEEEWQEIDLKNQQSHCFDVAMSGTHDVIIDMTR